MQHDKRGASRTRLDVDRLRDPVGKERAVAEVCGILLVLAPRLPSLREERVPARATAGRKLSQGIAHEPWVRTSTSHDYIIGRKEGNVGQFWSV